MLKEIQAMIKAQELKHKYGKAIENYSSEQTQWKVKPDDESEDQLKNKFSRGNHKQHLAYIKSDKENISSWSMNQNRPKSSSVTKSHSLTHVNKPIKSKRFMIGFNTTTHSQLAESFS